MTVPTPPTDLDNLPNPPAMPPPIDSDAWRPPPMVVPPTPRITPASRSEPEPDQQPGPTP